MQACWLPHAALLPAAMHPAAACRARRHLGWRAACRYHGRWRWSGGGGSDCVMPPVLASRCCCRHSSIAPYPRLTLNGGACGRQIIKDNGFEDKITLIHGKVEDVELPEKHSKVAAGSTGASVLLARSRSGTSSGRPAAGNRSRALVDRRWGGVGLWCRGAVGLQRPSSRVAGCLWRKAGRL